MSEKVGRIKKVNFFESFFIFFISSSSLSLLCASVSLWWNYEFNVIFW